MTRACTVCTHPKREEIDQAIVTGAPNRRIATHYNLSEGAVRRHKIGHLPAKIAKAAEAQEVAQADSLLDRIKSLTEKAHGILMKADTAGDLRTALHGVREARGCLELLAKVMGELPNETTTINLITSPQWVELRTALIRVLIAYPDAQRAVLKAIAPHEGENGK